MKNLLKYIFLFLFLSIQLLSPAQNKLDIDFNFQVDKVLTEKPNSYSEIEEAFKNDVKDTLKMKFLELKSKEESYLEGESFALCNLGISYRKISRYNSAIASHQNAYNLATSANNIELQVVNLNMLGVVNRRIA